MQKISKENFAIRLREYRALHGLTLKQLSERIGGVSPGFLSEVERGIKRPGSDLVFALETLLSEDDEVGAYRGTTNEFVKVPRYEIAASAGGGAVVHSEQIVDYLAFRAEWVRVALGVRPEHLAVISVMGDSMEPYLSDGDLILIDLSCTKIESDAIYIIQAGDALLVKRIQRRLDGSVVVRGDNQQYAAEIYREDQLASLAVIGRLIRRLVR